jgi:hypothetical protein
LAESPTRSFAAKDEIFCLFEGVLDNLGRLSQQYGLSKGANEVVLVIEAYKTLRDRAPYPASFMLSQLAGSYAFVLFDKSTRSLLVASVCVFAFAAASIRQMVTLGQYGRMGSSSFACLFSGWMCVSSSLLSSGSRGQGAALLGGHC